MTECLSFQTLDSALNADKSGVGLTEKFFMIEMTEA